MAILEKEVLVDITSRNIKHYEEKGYYIPRERDKSRRLTVKKGTKLLVKIEDLSEGSNIKLTKICCDCSKKSEQPYYSIITSRRNGDGLDRCHKCSSKQGGLTQKSNVKYESSLESFALNNGMEYLLKEFSEKNDKNPKQLSYGTKQVVFWDCPDCKSEYDMDVKQRTTGRKCPYCTGKRINDTNNLWKTHPNIANVLSDPQEGYKYTKGSHKKLEFKCPECDFKQKKTISNVTSKGLFSCKRCGDGLSYPEKFMFNVLEQLGINFETQKVFSWSDKKKYDFYIPFKNIIIETHGTQHYQESGFNRSLEEEQANDKYKMELAKKENIEYIVIDCRESTLEFIKESILKSTLNEIFNLRKIDWEESHGFAFGSNLVKKACEMWKLGYRSTVEISKMLKISRGAIVIYLKKGAELDWCDYNSAEAMKETLSKNGKKSGKKIVQLTKEGQFVKMWDSAKEAARFLDGSQGNISMVCLGKKLSIYGYKWMHKEDYDKILEENSILIN